MYLKSLPTIEDRFYINVPYSEKDMAKKLGAKWDPEKKSWFIPAGVNHSHFQIWINNNKNIDSNIRSQGFFIAESLELCWKCNYVTQVFTFLLPEKHQTKEYIEDEDITAWIIQDYNSMISFTNDLGTNPLELIKKMTSHYYMDFSKKSSSNYYMNHCEKCNAKLGDFYMHSEPGGAFQPMTENEAEVIKLHWHNELFEANVGTNSIDVNYYEHMKIISS